MKIKDDGFDHLRRDLEVLIEEIKNVNGGTMEYSVFDANVELFTRRLRQAASADPK